MDYTALWEAIQATPACAAHIVPATPKVARDTWEAGDQAIADILNASGAFDTSMPVPAWMAKRALIKRGRWRGIVLASQNASHPAVEAAYAAVALAEDARMDADFLDPLAAPLMAALVATGLMTADDRALLESMSRRPSAITAQDVSRAVRGPRE